MLGFGFGLGFTRGGGSSATFLSQFDGAAAAYSLRKLSDKPTEVVRVRRSDNVEQDFNAAEVANGSVTSFIGNSNLLRYSEQLDQSPWTTNLTTVTANQGTAPDGTNTADLITRGGGGGDEVFQVFTNKPNTKYHYSIYVKAGTGNLARVSLLGGAPGLNAIVVVDLSDGSISFQNADVEDVDVEDVGDGWYRVSISDTTNVTVAGPSVRISPDGTGNTILAWGAQLHEGTIGEYVKTEANALDGNGYVTTWYDQTVPTSDAILYFTGGADAVHGSFGFEDGVASTIEISFFYSTFSTYRIFGSVSGGGVQRHSLEINANGTVRFFSGSGGFTDTSNSVTSGVNTIVMTYDGSTGFTIQLNGGPVSSGSGSYTFNPNVEIGASYGGVLIGGITSFSKTDVDGTITWDGTRDGAIANGWSVTGEPRRIKRDLSRISKDANQTTAADQPLIVENSILVTEDGKPTIKFDGVDQFLAATEDLLTVGNDDAFSVFSVTSQIDGSEAGYVWNKADTSTQGVSLYAKAGPQFRLTDARIVAEGDTVARISDAHELISAIYNDNSATLARNGVVAGSNAFSYTFLSDTDSKFAIGNREAGNSAATHCAMKMQELIVYETDQSADRTRIEANINSHWGVYPSQFTPADLPSLKAWLDFADTDTITDTSGTVTAVTDKSGGGNDAAGFGTAPTTGTRTINGRNALDFTDAGALDILDSADFDHADEGFTVLAVLQMDNPSAANDIFFSKYRNNLGEEYSCGHTSGNGLYYSYSENNATLSIVGTAINPAAATTLIVGARYFIDGTYEFIYDRTLSRRQLTGLNIHEGAQPIRLGGAVADSAFFDGLYGEFLYFNRAISDDELNNVGSYLASKWDGNWSTTDNTAIVTHAGQSNATNAFAEGVFYGLTYDNDGRDAFLSTLGNYYTTVQLLDNAVSGTPVMEVAGTGADHWIDTDLTDGPKLTQWKTQLSGFVEGFGTGGATSNTRATVWIGGEGDIGQNEADFEAAIKQLYSEFRDYTSADHKVFVVLPGRRGAAFSDTYQRQRSAIIDAISDLDYVYFGADAFDLDVADGTHYTPEGQATLHTRIANRIAAVFGKRSEVGTLGPIITSATYSGTTVTATFEKDGGSDLSGTEVDQFRIEDDGTPVTINSLSIDNSANTITFTLSAAIGAGSTVQLWANYGRGAGTTTASIIRDANGLPLRSVKELNVSEV